MCENATVQHLHPGLFRKATGEYRVWLQVKTTAGKKNRFEFDIPHNTGIFNATDYQPIGQIKHKITSTMSNEILYILLPDYAAHEAVYLSQAIASDEFALKAHPKYVNKVVAPTMEPVTSIGGFRTLPDYTFDTMPDDYAALVLIGGFGWTTGVAAQVEPVIVRAMKQGKIVGAICNAASFMAKCGFLNAVKHTGNGLEQLKLWGGEHYTNPDGYVHAQAVSDKRIVTANGSATLEFAKELLLLLENDTPERIEMYYQFNKQGFCNLFPEN